MRDPGQGGRSGSVWGKLVVLCVLKAIDVYTAQQADWEMLSSMSNPEVIGCDVNGRMFDAQINEEQ